MKLIKPSEISAKIFTLLDESDERLTIVSPYVKISKWYKLVNKLNSLKSRRVSLDIYVRDGLDNLDTFRDLDRLGLSYKKVPHLHSKLYLNEKQGVFTSMNLLLSSEINSTEIAYATESESEYNELLEYFYRYIQSADSEPYIIPLDRPEAEMVKFMNGIRKELADSFRSVWPMWRGSMLYLCTGGDDFRVSIENGHLRISASLKIAAGNKHQADQSHRRLKKRIKDLSGMKVEAITCIASNILQLSAVSLTAMKSDCLSRMRVVEKAFVMKAVISFIEATDQFTGLRV